MLVYCLREKYESKNLCYASQEEPDQVIFGQLLVDCKEKGFYVCLARLEKSDENTSGLRYTTYEITHVSGLDGNEPLSHSSIGLIDSDIIEAKRKYSYSKSRPYMPSKAYPRSVSESAH